MQIAILRSSFLVSSLRKTRRSKSRRATNNANTIPYRSSGIFKRVLILNGRRSYLLCTREGRRRLFISDDDGIRTILTKAAKEGSQFPWFKKDGVLISH